MSEVQVYLKKLYQMALIEIKEQITALQKQGKTVMCLGTANEILAFIAVADEVRENIQRGYSKTSSSRY